MNIKLLPHTADIRMELHGESPQELFVLALKGMSQILKSDICEQTSEFNKKTKLEIQASDYTNLLIDFLSEVLSNSYVEKAIFCNANILEFSEFKIKAEIEGYEVEMFDEEIKAVTYHEANMQQDIENTLWKTKIVFDI